MRNLHGLPALLAMTLWAGCGGGAEPTPAHGACERADGTLEPASTVCRVAAGPCDVEEHCTGDAPDCPADTLVAAGTVCRAGDLATCDPAEACTGASPVCPPDETAHGSPPACCAPLPGIRDGGFEAVAHGWPDWTEQSSTSHGTPLCNTIACSSLLASSPPRTGDGWVVFRGGGLGSETAQVGQVVDLPAAVTGSALKLAFWLKVATCGVGTDFLRVNVDDTQVYRTSVADEGTFCADAGKAYEERTVDLSALAGAVHAVRFHSEIDATSSTAFLVDDVALTTCLK